MTRPFLFLSTDTNHHRYFFIELKAAGIPLHRVVFETTSVQAPFPVGPLFEEEQDAHERARWKGHFGLEDFEVDWVRNVNELASGNAVGGLPERLGIVFGTRKLDPRHIALFPDGLVNVHRGVTQRYRGLDSECWAVYHDDYESIGTTLHGVEADLDTGPIFAQDALRLRRGMQMYEFWVDELEDCLARAGTRSLRIDVGQECIQLPLGSDEERLVALDRIKSLCKRSRVGLKNRILDQVKEGTEVTPAVGARPDYRTLSWKCLREMSESPMFTIGGHSLYHDILSNQPRERMELDVATCLQLIRYKLEIEVVHFSYPEGQADHYTEAVIETLRRQGVVCSPSTVCGLNDASEDLFHLRRIMVSAYVRPFPYFDRRLAA